MALENPDAESAVTTGGAEAGAPESARPVSISRFKVAMVAVLILFGPVGALVVYLGSAPLYESQARILVKYVVDRRDSTGDEDLRLPESVSRRDKSSIVGAEIELLTSRDLAIQVAEAIGDVRLAPAGAVGADAHAAAVDVVMRGLNVEAPPDSRVLTLRFRHADPVTVVTILDAIVEQYFVRHMQIQRLDEDGEEIEEKMKKMQAEWKALQGQLSELTQDAESDVDVVRSLSDRQLEVESELRKMEAALGRVRGGHRSMPSIDIVQRPSVARRVREKEVVTSAITLAFLGPMIGAMLGLMLLRRRA